MLTARWQPFNQLLHEVDRLRRGVEEAFGRLPGDGWGRPAFAVQYPPVNVWQDDDAVYVEAELPGMRQDDLEIYVAEGDQLTLQGERRPSTPKEGVWHRQERGFGRFSRSFQLPVPVDADRVEARFEHGVLQVKLPKSERARPRRITVKAE